MYATAKAPLAENLPHTQSLHCGSPEDWSPHNTKVGGPTPTWSVNRLCQLRDDVRPAVLDGTLARCPHLHASNLTMHAESNLPCTICMCQTSLWKTHKDTHSYFHEAWCHATDLRPPPQLSSARWGSPAVHTRPLAGSRCLHRPSPILSAD